jgi:hypothetical protein
LKIIQGSIEEIIVKRRDPEPTEATYVETEKLLSKIVYGVSIKESRQKGYGTKENLKITSRKIYNVNGAYLALKAVIKKPQLIAENDMNYFRQDDLIGTLHIYDDQQPMKYEPSTP